jgi:hypothetical protein
MIINRSELIRMSIHVAVSVKIVTETTDKKLISLVHKF